MTSDIVVVEVKRPTSPRASQMDASKKQHFASEKRVRCYISYMHLLLENKSLASTFNSVGPKTIRTLLGVSLSGLLLFIVRLRQFFLRLCLLEINNKLQIKRSPAL